MDRRRFAKCALQTGVAMTLPGSRLASALVVDEPKATFSVMLWTLPKQLTFADRLHVAADAGYLGVEVGNEYEQWDADEWRRNLQAKESLGLIVDSAVPGRNALSDVTQRKALQADLERAIPGAKRLGCSQFIYTAYKRVSGQTRLELRSAIVDTLRYAADLLEKHAFEIVLEPIDLLEHKDEAVTSVVEAFEIVRAVGSTRVKVLYDFYHEQRQAGNLIESLEKNIDLVGLVHVADVPGRHRPGTGEICYENIYRKLAELKYRGVICMEFLPQGDAVQELKAARLDADKIMSAITRQ